MRANNECILFSRFFDPKDDQGQTIPGFFENLDFTGYSQTLEVIQEIAADNINAYLKNEYSRRYVVSTWARFMTWNKAEKRYEIDPAFYDEFSAALCGNLLTAENFYQLTKLDLEDIPEIIERVKEWGERHTETKRGNDTKTTGEREDNTTVVSGEREDNTTDVIGEREDNTTNVNAARTDTASNTYGARSDSTSTQYGQDDTTKSTVYGAQTNSGNVTNTVSAFNSATYQPHDKSDTTDNIGTHTDTETASRAQHTDATTTSIGSHTDGVSTQYGAHTDTEKFEAGEQTNTQKFEQGEQIDTQTHGDINVTADEYTDTETVTSSGKLDREKLYQIKAELAHINAYKLIGDAIAATMLRRDFDYSLDHCGVFFPI